MLKGRIYLDTLENYKKIDEKNGRAYIDVKQFELNQPTPYGATAKMLIDTYDHTTRTKQENEPVICWLAPPKSQQQSQQPMPSAPAMQADVDGLPF
jgi:hypothetical protein